MSICAQCAAAADRGAPPDEHCGDPKCTCAHRPPGERATHYAQQLAARERQHDEENQ